MVAIVSGNSLGLSNTSAAVLGQNGLIGHSANGTNNQKAVVNVSNGNLVLQNNDDMLDGRGLGVDSLLTYNAEGLSNEGNGYAWSMGMIKQIGSLTGTINTVGSTITRTEGDGSKVVYAYNAAGGNYVGHEGPGADDTISFITKTGGWIWTEGASGNTETYGKNGLIIGAADPSGNKLTYTYNSAGLLTKILDANGDSTNYAYNSANMLTQISDIVSGQTTSRIVYQYDSLNRLINATVDLTPSDNSTADSNVYWTKYTYVGSSNRIASVTQTDGSQLNIVYNAQNQVQSVTDALGNTTSFTYGANQSAVTDALGNVSTYTYDSAGRLTSVTLPAVNGVAQSMRYTYDSNGDLLSSKDTLGNTTNYSYDTNGNLLQSVDPDGDTVAYTYNGNNQLTSRTTYLVPATNGNPASGPQTTYFVYGAANLVAFEITSQGRVTQNT